MASPFPIPPLPNSGLTSAHVLCPRCMRVCDESKLLKDPPDVEETSFFVEGSRRTEEGEEIFPRVWKWRDLEQSCDPGCHFCSLARNAIVKGDEKIELANDGDVDVVVVRKSKECTVELKMNGKTLGQMPVYRAEGTLFLPVGIIGPAASLPISTGSSESCSLVKAWLQHCIANHSSCNTRYQTTSDSRLLPTRLVNIGEPGTTLSPHLLLTSTCTKSEQIPYLTLSHSWGTGDMFKLLTSNLTEMQHQIPLQKLSQTFRDAMLITKRLGYQYIWIDSLCIIQDSAEDWIKEAATMTDVYGNSTCNIAALGASGHQGCFARRNPLVHYPCRIPNTTQGTSDVYVYKLNAAYLDSRAPLGHAPLLTRAWVVQERLIAPRNIYFGANELVWECCEHGVSESWPYTVMPGTGHFGKLPLKVKFETVLKPITARDPVPGMVDRAYATFLAAWHEILRYYTGTNLTFASDRMVALAGVTKAIQRRTGLNYIGGIWKELWPHDLLWRAKEYKLARQQPPSWRAPSWSWASRDGQVEYDDLHQMMETSPAIYLTRVLDYKILPITDRATALGEISEGVMVLTGFLLRAITKREYARRGSVLSHGVELSGGRRQTIYADDELPDGTVVFLFLVIRLKSGWVGYMSKGNSKYFEIGLVLAAHGEEGGYKRVGYFRNSGTVAARNAFEGTEEEQVVSIY